MDHYSLLIRKFEQNHIKWISVPIALYLSFAMLAYAKTGELQYATVFFSGFAVILIAKLYIGCKHKITVEQKKEGHIVVQRSQTPAWYRNKVTNRIPLMPHTLALIAGPMLFGLATLRPRATYSIAHRFAVDEVLTRSNDKVFIRMSPPHLMDAMPFPAVVVTKHLYNKSFFLDIMTSFWSNPDAIKFIFGVRVYAFRGVPAALFNGYAIPKSGWKHQRDRHRQHDEMLSVVQKNTTIFFPSGWEPKTFSPTAALLSFASGVPIIFTALKLRHGHVHMEYVLVDGKTHVSHENRYIQQAVAMQWPAPLQSNELYADYRKRHYTQAKKLMHLWYSWFVTNEPEDT